MVCCYVYVCVCVHNKRRLQWPVVHNELRRQEGEAGGGSERERCVFILNVVIPRRRNSWDKSRRWHSHVSSLCAYYTGVRVFVEPKALFHVVGTTMDFQTTPVSSEFVFENPNAKGSCGCGESFNV